MDAWAWSKRVGELLAEMKGAKALLIVGTGATAHAEEIASRHQLTLVHVNGFLRPGSFLVTTDQEARGGTVDG